MTGDDDDAEPNVRPLTWVIQANMRDRQNIETALDSLGEHHHSVSLIPFSREIPELPFSADPQRIVSSRPHQVAQSAPPTPATPS